MTLADSEIITSGFASQQFVYYMLEANLPAAGAHTVAISYSTSVNNVSVAAMSFYNVKQQAPEATNSSTATSTATMTTSITTLTDNALIITAMSDGSAYTHTPNSGQTEEYDLVQSSSAGAGGYIVRETAGAGNIQWTCSSSTNRMCQVLAAFASSGGGEITDFPMYYTAAIAGAKSDASDILFADINGNKLDHEVEAWDSYTWYFRGWIRIPTLSGTADTTIYVYYGNENSTDQSNPTGVWDTNFKAIYHLNENTLDSTSNNNDGSINGTVIDYTGKLAGAKDFAGDTDYIEVPTNSSLTLTSQATLEAWVNLTDANVNQKIICKYDLGATGGYILGVQTNALYPEMFNGTDRSFTAGTISNSTWTYLTVTWLSNSAVVGYINGTQVGTVANGTADMAADTEDLVIGAESWNTRDAFEVDGTIDEVRISNIKRSSGYIKTSFNNQNSPGTFYSTGSIQSNYIPLTISNESSISLRLLRYT